MAPITLDPGFPGAGFPSKLSIIVILNGSAGGPEQASFLKSLANRIIFSNFANILDSINTVCGRIVGAWAGFHSPEPVGWSGRISKY